MRLLVLAGGLAAGFGAAPPVPLAQRATASPPPAAVAVRGFGFRPDTLAVPVGTRVVWTNGDDIPHTVTPADRAARFGGALERRGDSLSATFTAAGKFPYACARHPFMRGAITEDHRP
jgi:plastocyanin